MDYILRIILISASLSFLRHFFPFKIIYFDEDCELLETISAIFLSIGIAVYPALLIGALKKAKRVEEQLAEEEGFCRDCGQSGHKRKTNKKCILYNDDSRVWKKRRMDPEDDAKHKRQKKDGQAARHARTLKLSVKKLYQPSAEPKERIIQKFGKDHERFTRCAPFENVVRPAYRQILQQAVAQKSSLLREILTRAYMHFFPKNLLSKQQARRIANQYLYEVVAGGEPALDLWKKHHWNFIKNVSANPGLFIPVLYAILQEFQREHEVASKMGTKTATKLFALTPRPNFQWRFITINEKALRALTGIRSEHPFEIFDLTKYRFLT
ncbi:hypothetical protein VTP01DRAFT_1173 [Rhizomucor pusillus]|uniref:uncharacterized protein n=1 Tax=Rhizomucor pusillus TaxID=4840 RepID=UPI0037432D53